MIALLVGASVAFAVAILTTFALILFAKSRRAPEESTGPQTGVSAVPRLHFGGVILWSSIVVGYLSATFLSQHPLAQGGILILLLLAGLVLVGFTVDLLERRRRGSAGLRRLVKFGGQAIAAAAFASVALNDPNARGVRLASGHLSFLRDLPGNMLSIGVVGEIVAVAWISLIIGSAATAVTAIRRYDGLSAGVLAAAVACYVFIAAWEYNESCTNTLMPAGNLYKCYTVRDPESIIELTVFVLAALVGFLWWNTHPAQVELGASGSLLLGGAVAAFAVTTHTELLLIILLTVFVVIARITLPSPRTQTTPERRARTFGAMRFVGGTEITIVVRFWIIAALLAAVGVAAFYGAWLSQ